MVIAAISSFFKKKNDFGISLNNDIFIQNNDMTSRNDDEIQ